MLKSSQIVFVCAVLCISFVQCAPIDVNNDPRPIQDEISPYEEKV